jgi:hypothetical protein
LGRLFPSAPDPTRVLRFPGRARIIVSGVLLRADEAGSVGYYVLGTSLLSCCPVLKKGIPKGLMEELHTGRIDGGGSLYIG